MKPLAVDLFCGLGGWTEGLIAEGYEVIGFDIERHAYGDHRYPAQLVLQDVRTIDGAQCKDAALIVASPPCPEFSYMAMPWTRAKQIAEALRGRGEFPTGYAGSRTIAELTALFDACCRIQREASEAAGRYVPMVIENVRGAQPWVGRARWMYGSFALWGDVPALMPITLRVTKVPGMGAGWRPPGHPDHQPGLAFNTHAERAMVADESVNGRKHGGDWFSDPDSPGKQGGVTHRRISEAHRSKSPAKGYGEVTEDGVKQGGISGERDNGKGDRWFQDGAAASGSKSSARKAASARIAKIPLPLARHIAKVYYPSER